jgi:disulfide bond formation protein DsbB
VQGRYAVIPSILLIFCIYRIFQISKNFLKYISLILILLSLLTGTYEYKINTKYPEFLICEKECPNWKNEVKKWKEDENYHLKIWQYPQKTMSLRRR